MIIPYSNPITHARAKRQELLGQLHIQPMMVQDLLNKGGPRSTGDQHHKEMCLQSARHIKGRGLFPVFQPIWDPLAERVAAYEALTRTGAKNTLFSNEARLLDPTNAFYIYLEFLCAVKCIKRFKRIAPTLFHERFATPLLFINLSPYAIVRLFKNACKFSNYIHERLGLRANEVVLEITEQYLALKDRATFLQALHYLRDYGYQVAMDDFGQGHSNVNRLIDMVPEYVKIDMYMLRDIDTSVKRQKVVCHIVSLAKDLNAKVVAEGIQTKDEYDCVIGLGVDLVQGYYINHPAEHLWLPYL